MENKGKGKEIVGLKEKYCAACGKMIFPTYQWIYKLGHKNKDNTITYKYYCSYTHWREAGGGNAVRITKCY